MLYSSSVRGNRISSNAAATRIAFHAQLPWHSAFEQQGSPVLHCQGCLLSGHLLLQSSRAEGHVSMVGCDKCKNRIIFSVLYVPAMTTIQSSLHLACNIGLPQHPMRGAAPPLTQSNACAVGPSSPSSPTASQKTCQMLLRCREKKRNRVAPLPSRSFFPSNLHTNSSLFPPTNLRYFPVH